MTGGTIDSDSSATMRRLAVWSADNSMHWHSRGNVSPLPPAFNTASWATHMREHAQCLADDPALMIAACS